jgi:ATP-dependent helicase HrpB
VPLKAALESIFSPEQFRELDRLAPASFRLPSGASIHFQYTEDRHPILAVRVQDLFGVTTTPTVAHGTIPVVLHMLSPARRPLAVTGDLRSFWTTTYPTIRQQMKSRYPKHQWPENPMAPGTASGRGAHTSTR